MSFVQRLRLAAMATLLLEANAALAGNVTIPNTFVAHTPALAGGVNTNFSAVATAVNGNAGDIASLQAAITSLQATVTTLNNTVVSQQNTINTLTSQMAAVQGSSVMALAANLDIVNVPDPNDANILYPTAQFHGINVQIVNGMGTESSTNGLGNLIVGYNPVDLSATLFCSLGDYTEQTGCESNGGAWARNQRSGSHNLIAGAYNAYSQYGGFLAGANSIVNGPYSSVSGGYFNTARNYGSVSGGAYNTANGYVSSVSGGKSNATSGDFSSVSGGQANKASGYISSVSGGSINTASGGNSSVSGGESNTAGGSSSSVSGGNANTSSGYASSVSGGRVNTANNYASSVSGGLSNTASADSSSVSGGNLNNASGFMSSVSGGYAHDATDDYNWRAGTLFEDL